MSALRSAVFAAAIRLREEEEPICLGTRQAALATHRWPLVFYWRIIGIS